MGDETLASIQHGVRLNPCPSPVPNASQDPPMNPNASAQLAVVLCTDCFATIRRIISCLRSQTVREQIEIVIIAPSRARLAADESMLGDFWSVKVLEVGEIANLAPAMAAGIRAAEAPVVFLGETHAYPQPDWAERLIAAHRGRWAAVVPGI